MFTDNPDNLKLLMSAIKFECWAYKGEEESLEKKLERIDRINVYVNQFFGAHA